VSDLGLFSTYYRTALSRERGRESTTYLCRDGRQVARATPAIHIHYTYLRFHDPRINPTKDKIRRTIAKMKSDKAPGTSQLTTNMLKNLPKDALTFVTETIQEFWQQDTDFSSWHITKLNILYKGKGDPQDLNNYRGICLKETCTKIISSIVSHRLLLHLKTFGSKTQFGHDWLPRSPTCTQESSTPMMAIWPTYLCTIC